MNPVAKAAFAVIVAAGTGCAITNYSLITDNDQVRSDGGSGAVNTAGKAKIHLPAQVAWVYADGTDELFHMVDQTASGDRTLTTYNNYSTGGDPTLLDDLYCNPDWQGCAIFTAPDPETGDRNAFDGTFNERCSGARSLSKLVSTSRYYGECGRARLPLTDRVALLNMGSLANVKGREALLFPVGRRQTRITLDNNAGIVVDIPVSGEARVSVHADGARQVQVDATHPLLASVVDRVADFLDAYGTDRTTVTVTYNGISIPVEVGGEPFNAERLRRFARARF